MRLLYTIVFWCLLFNIQAQTGFKEAELMYENMQIKEAKDLFLKHYNANPKDLKAIEYLGDIASHEKNWDEAIEYYGMLVEGDKSNANYHYKFGGALGMKSLSVSKFKALSIIDDVEREFLKAAELDKNHIDARWALVELYVKLPPILGGTLKNALKYAQELEELSQVDGYLSKGFVYDHDGDYNKAEIFYIKAIQTGGSETCYQKLTDFYLKNKQKEKAIAILEEAYKVHQKTDYLLQIEQLNKSN